MSTNEVKECLNNLVATQGLFYTKLHQAHWYIRGHHFFDLHVKLEDYYDEITVHMDDTAERLLQLGGEPYSTLQEFIDHSAIEESLDNKYIPEEPFVKAVIKDFEKLRDELAKGIDLVDENNDDVTVDMLIEQKAYIDKVIWMLWAYSGKNALGK
ncbi:DNA starvation/stationary phase protection protein [Alkalibacterium putridalgicola]|jgi:starvation-inducible DNA-binding protein|uniref:DNA protection during starvation protein n=1 Tax=Alkalibacterium putridalgicola TaxID=426703 RepID=A0A1H7XHW8_9LACT|nr:DNA starvation/stationary phase protection protein [Alkalibacterium putridalgicola]GEK90314.1 DNA protection during starvation protein [Alkalibacterium putridalgicola]SEM33502.1 starvation-inducible DNA-binding protein [Alkalibacterium putridalgicola]